MTAPDPIADFLFEVAKLGRSDAFAKRLTHGPYHPLSRQVTLGDVTNHLSNRQPIGIYLVEGRHSRIAAIDLDDHDGDGDRAKMIAAATRLYEAALEHGLRPFVVRSGGGKGIHLFVLFRNKQEARLIRALLRTLLGQIGLAEGTGGVDKGQAEIFPKQNEVAEGGLGNLIALPFARSSLPLDPSSMEPVLLADFSIPPFEELLSPDLAGTDEAEPARPNHMAKPMSGDAREVESALNRLNADDYSLWIIIGFALKHAFGDEGYAIWLAWSEKSVKFPGEAKSRKKWDGFSPLGQVGLGTIFHHAQAAGWNGPSNPLIREMNGRFGILARGTKDVLIILKNGDRRPDDEVELIGIKAFHERMKAEPVQAVNAEGQPVTKSKSKIWIDHPLAERYHNLEFDPSKPPGGNGRTWNIWRGFPHAAIPGSWDRLKEHLFVNIASGNEESYNWLLNWFAWGIQNPAKLPGTCPVLLGPPGVGKSFLADRYGALWLPHYLAITNIAHVLGKFNAHFVGRRFVFIDEGMFGGNRKEAGVIKARITENQLLMEMKGVDAIPMRNRAMVMVASNEDSVVPADLGDRRWMVLNVGTKHQEDHAFFAAIDDELRAGGYEAMMFELLHRDTSLGPNPLKTIKTAELFMQILRAQPPFVQYLHRILEEGRLPQNTLSGPGSSTVRALLMDMRQQHPELQRFNDNALGMKLRDFFPGITHQQNGRYKPPFHREGEPYERSTRYDFPPLAIAREMFSKKIGCPIAWSSDVTAWTDDYVNEDGPI
jgi:hypothetical protein